ncbi:protein kinase, putative, partial [Hepatocystis sp. ex Piliocolobus tephrosceles]
KKEKKKNVSIWNNNRLLRYVLSYEKECLSKPIKKYNLIKKYNMLIRLVYHLLKKKKKKFNVHKNYKNIKNKFTTLIYKKDEYINFRCTGVNYKNHFLLTQNKSSFYNKLNNSKGKIPVTYVRDYNATKCEKSGTKHINNNIAIDFFLKIECIIYMIEKQKCKSIIKNIIVLKQIIQDHVPLFLCIQNKLFRHCNGQYTEQCNIYSFFSPINKLIKKKIYILCYNNMFNQINNYAEWTAFVFSSKVDEHTWIKTCVLYMHFFIYMFTLYVQLLHKSLLKYKTDIKKIYILLKIMIKNDYYFFCKKCRRKKKKIVHCGKVMHCEKIVHCGKKKVLIKKRFPTLGNDNSSIIRVGNSVDNNSCECSYKYILGDIVFYKSLFFSIVYTILKITNMLNYYTDLNNCYKSDKKQNTKHIVLLQFVLVLLQNLNKSYKNNYNLKHCNYKKTKIFKFKLQQLYILIKNQIIYILLKKKMFYSFENDYIMLCKKNYYKIKKKTFQSKRNLEKIINILINGNKKKSFIFYKYYKIYEQLLILLKKNKKMLKTKEDPDFYWFNYRNLNIKKNKNLFFYKQKINKLNIKLSIKLNIKLSIKLNEFYIYMINKYFLYYLIFMYNKIIPKHVFMFMKLFLKIMILICEQKSFTLQFYLYKIKVLEFMLYFVNSLKLVSNRHEININNWDSIITTLGTTATTTVASLNNSNEYCYKGYNNINSSSKRIPLLNLNSVNVYKRNNVNIHPMNQRNVYIAPLNIGLIGKSPTCLDNKNEAIGFGHSSKVLLNSYCSKTLHYKSNDSEYNSFLNIEKEKRQKKNLLFSIFSITNKIKTIKK